MIKFFLLFFVLVCLLHISDSFLCTYGRPTCAAGQFIFPDVASILKYGTWGSYYDYVYTCTCTNCPRGTYCAGGCEQSCSLCHHHYYQDLEGQSSCKSCPNGKKTLYDTRTSVSECFCPTDTHLMINGHCTACVSGVSYKQNNIHACKCALGYYCKCALGYY